eukprot:3715418-Prymnesium_polylepis.1
MEDEQERGGGGEEQCRTEHAQPVHVRHARLRTEPAAAPTAAEGAAANTAVVHENVERCRHVRGGTLRQKAELRGQLRRQ